MQRTEAIAHRIAHHLARAVGALLLTASLCAAAQAPAPYPSRPVKILVGAPPGGSTDIIARLAAQKLQERLGQPFVVENRAGANMIIASEAAARAPADGYTLIMVPSNHVINGGLYTKLSYDPIKDFAPIARLANLPLAVIVHPSLPVGNMRELIAYAKSRNGDLAFSSSGIGSPHHLGMELIKYTAKIEMTHVPFKGASDALAETLAGRVPVGIFTVPPVLAQVKAGKLRRSPPPARDASRCFRTCRPWPNPAFRALRSTSGSGCSLPPGRRR